MNVLTVAYLHCSNRELRDRSVFEEAAKFTQWECTVYIRCEDTGQDLQVSCPAPGANVTPGTSCWGWRFFCDKWIRKHGQIV